jgi:hypothetical protein
MTVETRPLSEVISDAIRVLVSQLGPANTARVISYFSVAYGNYTEERQQLFANYTVDDIVREIKEHKEHGGA